MSHEKGVADAAGRSIRTVLGDISSERSGTTLFHEHLLSDWYAVSGDLDAKLTDPELVISELKLSRRDGLVTMVDATTPDIPGRDPLTIQRIAAESGVNVIIGSGLYREPMYPPGDLDVVEVTETFCEQIEVGMSGTSVRAGVLGELGTSPGGPTERETRVLQAAAHAQVRTGAGIITHTMLGQDALIQLDILEAAGADPARTVIGHLDCLDDFSVHAQVAQRGAFVGIDRVGLDEYLPDTRRVEMVLALLDAGFQDRILLSSDVAKISRLRVSGGEGYSPVLLSFSELLRQAGVPKDVLNSILVDNPRELLSIPTSRSAQQPVQFASVAH